MPYVPIPSAVVAGYAAAVLGRYLARAAAEGAFAGLGDPDRVLGAVRDLQRAGEAWRRAVDEASDHGSTETAVAATPPPSEHMGIDEAAGVLGVSRRQARNLAPSLGAKVAGRWLLDRGLVAEEARRRREAA